MTVRRKPYTWLLCLIYLWIPAGHVTAAEDGVEKKEPEVKAEVKEEGSETAVEKPDETPAEPKKPEEKPAGKEPAEKKADEKKADEKKADEKKPVKKKPVEKKEEPVVAVARPVSADPVQIYGWREWVVVSDGKFDMEASAKLDTGALTSSIHVEEKVLFERDGKKWVRFVTTNLDEKDPKRLRIEAPLVRIAQIKEPGEETRDQREVVKLSFKIGARKIRAEFTLNDRTGMNNPILLGRNTIRVLGWVDPGRAYLADKKVMR